MMKGLMSMIGQSLHGANMSLKRKYKLVIFLSYNFKQNSAKNESNFCICMFCCHWLIHICLNKYYVNDGGQTPRTELLRQIPPAGPNLSSPG